MDRIVRKVWGSEDWLTCNEHYVVKRLNIQSGENISLQYHAKKDEFWYVLEGSGLMYMNGYKSSVRSGDYIRIKPGDIHTIKAIDGELKILETSTTQVSDVVRISREVNFKCL